MALQFAERTTVADIEAGSLFQPGFDADGLIPAVVTDAAGGAILMFAWMNREALGLTISTKVVHFYSRSRAKLWQKGEESGNVLDVVEMRTDCDQDVVQVIATVRGAGVACHTGATSCFYRQLDLGAADAGPVRLTRA